MANMTFIEDFQNIDVSSSQGFLQSVLFNNTMLDYLIFLGISIALLIAMKLFKIYIIKVLKVFAKKTKTSLDDIIISIFNRLHWPFHVFISFYFASKSINMHSFIDKALKYALVIFLTYYTIVALGRIIDYFIDAEIAKRKAEDRGENAGLMKILANIGKFFLWIIGFLFVLSNFGVEITPLIAGLGVGGIAIAFALQKILEDLFSSFAIYLDKPFKEGDFIVVGADKGVVQHIGLKTTRIKALQGEELVISNTELTSTRINNYKKMDNRRISFRFGVEYSTTSAKLKKAVQIVEKVIKDMPKVDLDRVHFFEFGDFSLNFEVVYYVQSNDYTEYMNNQQEMNLKIKDAFEKAGIVMAFPTQTIHMVK